MVGTRSVMVLLMCAANVSSPMGNQRWWCCLLPFTLHTALHTCTYGAIAKARAVTQIDRKMQGVPFIYILTGQQCTQKERRPKRQTVVLIITPTATQKDRKNEGCRTFFACLAMANWLGGCRQSSSRVREDCSPSSLDQTRLAEQSK